MGDKKLNRKISSVLVCAMVIASISAPITQNVGQSGPSPTSGGTGGLANSPWPMFRGNMRHTGLSPYDTSTNSGKEKWNFTTDGSVRSSPAIGPDGTIYVGSYDNKLYAINTDGLQLWNYNFGDWALSSPAICSDGTIYVGVFGNPDGKLFAINSDGTKKWHYTMPGQDVSSSPVIGSDGTIYIGAENGNMYAINPDGTEKWKISMGSLTSSPAIGSEGTIYIGSHDNNLYAINPDGTEKWSYTTGDSIAYASPSIGSDGTIYIGSGDYKLYAIKPDGTKKWSFTTGDSVASSPAIGSDGTIYIGSFDDKLYAINSDGTEKWSLTIGDWILSSPAIGSDGTIYIGSDDHKLYAINPDGTEKWSFIAGHNIDSSPAIDSDGTVYFGSTDGKLYAIGTTTQNLDVEVTSHFSELNSAAQSAITVHVTDGTNPVQGATVNLGSDNGGIFSPQSGITDANGNFKSIFNAPTVTTQIICRISAEVSKTGYNDGAGYVDVMINPIPWPMFRQNLNHTGLSPYDTSANNGQLKWSFATSQTIDSSPVIDSDGNIYIGSRDKHLYAIYPNGTKKWSFRTGSSIFSSAAISSDGTIFIGSDDYKIYAINPDGSEKWNFTTGERIQSPSTISPEGTIYFGSFDHKLYAINPDGMEKWNFITGGRIWSSPAISFNGTIYIGSEDSYLYAINPDGTEKWSFMTGNEIRATPAIDSNGTIYIGSHDNKLYAINPDGTEKWNFNTGSWVVSSPAIGSDGTIYIGSPNGNFYAINPDGTEKWSLTTILVVNSSPAVGSDGSIYIGSWDGKLFAINPDGTEKWNLTTTGYRMESSPAIGADGTIYIGCHDGKLYAVGTPNIPPISNAGPDQTINEGEEAVFNVSGSYDPDGTIARYEFDFGDGTSHVWEPSTTNVTGTEILAYVTRAHGAYNRTWFDYDLPRVLAEEGFNADVTGVDQIDEITSGLLSNYDQLWILSTNFTSTGVFSPSEISTILGFHENGGGLLIMADHTYGGASTATDANQISTNYGVTFYGFVNHGHAEIDPFIVDHPLNENVDTIWGHWSEADLTITNPDVEVIAVHDGYEMIAVLDVEGEGRMVFDTSVTRMEDGGDPNGHDILKGDNVQYAKNIAKWLGEGFASEPPPLINHAYGDDGLGTDGIYTMTLTVTDNKGATATDTCIVTVNNLAPTIDPFGPFVVSEGSPVTITTTAYDPGSDDLIFTWDFELDSTVTNTYFNDGTAPDPYPSPHGTYPFSASDIVEQTYGDDGIYCVDLTVQDDDGGTAFFNTTITVNNIAPSTAMVIVPSGDEGSSLTFTAEAADPGSDDLTFEWEFEYGPTIENIHYNDGVGPEPIYDPITNEIKSPSGVYPINASDMVTHTYGDDYNYTLTLRVTDDDGGTTTYTTTIAVDNVAPSIIEIITPSDIDEGSLATFQATVIESGSDDLTFTWEFDQGPIITNVYYNDGTSLDPYPSPWGAYPFSVTDTVEHTYGDNGVYRVTLTVEDDDGGSTTYITNITVNNVAPTIVNIEYYMYVNFTLRVAGEKWHSVNMTLYEDNTEIWNAGVTRQPGSPDEQAATLSGYSINLGSSYRAVVDYIPNDPRMNGNVWGGNPVWIILEFQDGTTERLHHTFNVRQSYWDSDHWNHIDPWEVDLTSIIYKHNVTFEATATDLGSDDLTFNWSFGEVNTHYNNGLGPDPFPSPDGVFPFSATDIVGHAYSGPETIYLTVIDDDGGTSTATISLP